MAIGDFFSGLGQRVGRGLTAVGGYDPMQQVSPEEAARRRQEGLSALQRSLGRSSAILSGDPRRIALAEEQMQKAAKDKALREFVAQNPEYADMLKLYQAGVDPRMFAGEKRQTYKPELVEFRNTSDKPIQVGNVVIQPGQQMPFNVAIPEIANAISGVPGLKEIKDTTVYTRQGNTYLTETGNYKEIIVGDRRIFDGPTGQLSAEEFFAKYPKARMTTSGEEQRYIPDFKTFTGLNKELVTEEKSLKQILSYWENIKDSNVGIERLGDQMATWFKTLAGSQNLTTEELARAIAEGKLQGLIGANRIDTVGGGVMTEKDAWRVIARLGGDVNALQNPAVVGPLLEEMFRLKVESYNEDIKGYNMGVESGRFKGYEKRTPITEEEITSKFTLLPQGIPAGSKKVVVQGITLYQSGNKYYAVLPDGTVEEVEID